MHTRKVWSEEAMETLRDCFDTTIWDVFCEDHGENIDSLTSCVTDYINFCVDTTIPTKTVRLFSNNKPWITPDIKALLNDKRRAFRSGDREQMKCAQRELRSKIREGKSSYRRRMEEQLQQCDVSGVWRSLKTISGHNNSRPELVRDQEWVNNLNRFFNRFDQPVNPPPVHPPQPALSVFSPTGTSADTPRTTLDSSPLSANPPQTMVPPTFFATDLPQPSRACTAPHSPLLLPPPSPSVVFSKAQVERELARLKIKKATGPDGISSRLLKSCAKELSGIVMRLFNMSLGQQKVPQLWKTSCVVPVPKISRPSELNHFRPVALTAHLVKTLERLVLQHLRPLVGSSADPLQFAYRPGIGVEDAVIFLTQRSLSHLERSGNIVRIMFYDFSSAFNTIKPDLLRDKLDRAGVHHHLSAWLLDFLCARPQFVRTQGCVSDTVVCSTGAPQGTVLAPLLFTIYTDDYTHYTTNCHLQKFSDDSAVVGLIKNGDESEYREVNKNFVAWCQQNQLQINAGKTKELVVDFRRRKDHPLVPVNIQGIDIEIVDSYKYLGVHLNKKLDWTTNTQALYKRGQSRLHLLRRLRSFGVQDCLLRTFYDSVVASVVMYGVVCWCSSITAAEAKKLNKLVRKAGSVVGCILEPVEVVGDRRMTKLSSILGNVHHPLHGAVAALESPLSSSSRFIHPLCKTERYRRSFLPHAVRLYNNSLR